MDIKRGTHIKKINKKKQKQININGIEETWRRGAAAMANNKRSKMADSRGKAINSFRCKFAPHSTPIYAPLLFFHPTFTARARDAAARARDGRLQKRNWFTFLDTLTAHTSAHMHIQDICEGSVLPFPDCAVQELVRQVCKLVAKETVTKKGSQLPNRQSVILFLCSSSTISNEEAGSVQGWNAQKFGNAR